MKIESVELSKLKEDPQNARKHDKKNLDAIAGSLKKFGQQKPIVIDKNGVILAGNGTFQAAKKLKLKHLECVRTDLEGDEANAYALADNRTQELSTWDDEILSKALADLCAVDFDIGEIGFDETFVRGHVRDDVKGEIEDDEVPEVTKNIHNVQRGQIWKLGEHLLMCGDSTSESDVAKLMDGQKADMVFTDPPYGVDAVGGDKAIGGERIVKANSYDRVIGDENKDCARNVVPILLKISPMQIIWGAHHFCHALPESSGWLYWQKNQTGDFADGELAWTNHKGQCKRFEHTWAGLIKASEHGEKRVHPTQKPVALAEWCFKTYAPDSKIVVDLFGGSGSTLIACEKTNRKCFMMELDEHYCSVIIERWQQFTGQKASLITEA